jgi:hypothetical protein
MALRAPLAIAAVLTLVAVAASALAQDRPRTVAKESCAAPAPPPPEMAGWTSPTDLTAARHPSELASAALVLGQAFTVRLSPVTDVEFRVPPEKADGPQVHGGMFGLKIVQAGTYRMVSDAGPWMDVFQGQTPVTSIAHGHGPACTGLGKYVDFPLQPGDYLVQISESLSPTTKLMVALEPK